MNKVQMAHGIEATSDIGRELAKIFAKEDFQPFIVVRDQGDDAAKELNEPSGPADYLLVNDQFDPEAAFEIYNEVKAINQAIDLLLNDSGQGYYAEFAESDLRRQLSTIQLNICSLVSNTHLFLKDFLAEGAGTNLNFSPVISKAPGPWQAVYHATKAFVPLAQLTPVE